MSSESENATPPTETNGESPKPDYAAWQRYSLMAGVGGIAAFVFFAFFQQFVMGEDRKITQFYLSYQVGFVFWLSMPLGSLALLLIQYLTTGQWGLLLQRVFEANTRTLPLFILLFIPLAVGLNSDNLSPYWWTNELKVEEHVHEHDEGEGEEEAEGEKPPEEGEGKSTDGGHAEEGVMVLPNDLAVHELEKKQDDFLNPMMFGIVGGAAFLFWGLWSFMAHTSSKTPDSGSEEENGRQWGKGREFMVKIAGPGLLLHALCVTACATQWVMSLEATWHSTMFPVIFGINQLLTAYAFGIILVLLLARPGFPLEKKITPLHQIDLGSFLLAFTLFWTYISFSQFMLVWVGNLPEEIPFFLKRTRGGWQYIAVILLVFHFALPFLLLLFRHVKFNAFALRCIAAGLIAMCAFDVFFWIEPSYTREGTQAFWLLDLSAIVGIGGIWLCTFLWQYQKRDLLPPHEEYRLQRAHDDH